MRSRARRRHPAEAAEGKIVNTLGSATSSARSHLITGRVRALRRSTTTPPSRIARDQGDSREESRRSRACHDSFPSVTSAEKSASKRNSWPQHARRVRVSPAGISISSAIPATSSSSTFEQTGETSGNALISSTSRYCEHGSIRLAARPGSTPNHGKVLVHGQKNIFL